MKNTYGCSVVIIIVAGIMAVLCSIGVAWFIGSSDLPLWFKFLLLK